MRDELATRVRGWIEVPVPFGRADVATATDVFEVEPISRWQTGVRQVLAYAAATGLRANVALFGPTPRDQQLKIYLRLRDRCGMTPVRLWLHCQVRGWQLITNRQDAQRRRVQ